MLYLFVLLLRQERKRDLFVWEYWRVLVGSICLPPDTLNEREGEMLAGKENPKKFPEKGKVCRVPNEKEINIDKMFWYSDLVLSLSFHCLFVGELKRKKEVLLPSRYSEWEKGRMELLCIVALTNPTCALARQLEKKEICNTYLSNHTCVLAKQLEKTK